jgi:hypothetical protein
MDLLVRISPFYWTGHQSRLPECTATEAPVQTATEPELEPGTELPDIMISPPE